MSMWGAFAIFVATAWDRISQRSQLTGVGLVGIAAICLGWIAYWQPQFRAREKTPSSWTTWDALQMLPASSWSTLRPMLLTFAVSLVVASVIALYLAAKNRPRLCVTVLAVGMIPIALSLADAIARLSPQFSLANVSRLLDKQLTDKDAVVYEGELDDASSLVFYLHRRFYLVNQPPNDEMHIAGGADISITEEAILRHWGDPQAIYLIIRQERIPHWQQLLTDRFHIYHQVTASGQSVVLTNQL